MKHSWRVTLDEGQQLRVTVEGERRARYAVDNGMLGKNGQEPSDDGHREAYVQGTGAELAASIALRLPWVGCGLSPNNTKTPDLGRRTEVRGTKWASGHLMVYPADDAKGFYVLVTGELPDYLVVGWTTGRDAKQDKYLQTKAVSNGRTPAPAYWVPQSDLLELNIFPAKCEA